MTRSNNIISWASKKMNIFKNYLQKIGGEDRKGQRGGKKSLREGKQGNIREGIKVFSDWPTIPQLYIKKEFVGGCDIVKEMYENGELKKILDDKGISYKN